jgi:glycosyltransferase involved in cell wall biosynthesis
VSASDAARQPRILFLGDHFGYAGGVLHGVTSYYLAVLPKLLAHGAAVECCFMRESHPAAKQLEELGVPVHFLGASKWNPFLVSRIERLARAMRANILHVANMKSAALGRIVARRIGAAVFIHSHDMNVPPLPARWAYRLFGSGRERGLAVSTAAADLMPRAYAVARDAVALLPNAIDVTTLQAEPAGALPTGIPAAPPRIAWAGRLHEVKGPQRMIRAMRSVVATIPDAHLVLAGDGPQRGECERLVAQLGLQQNISLLGQRRDLSKIFRHVELLCVTSHNEGFSLVAAEAAAAGLPVVAYAVGGLTEVVQDGQTGLLVRDGDEAALVAALCALLGDEPRRRRLGAEASVRIRRYSLEGHLQRLLSEYERALADDLVGSVA